MTGVLLGVEATLKALKLKKISVDESGWVTTYKDETTHEIWVLDYPESEHHGGGLPRLTLTGTG